MALSLRFRMQHLMVVRQKAWRHSASAKQLRKASITVHEGFVSCHIGTAAATEF